MKPLNLKELDDVSKLVLIVLAAIVGYFLVFAIVSPFGAPQETSVMQTMNTMMGAKMMNFSTTGSRTINLLSLIFAGGLGFVISLYLFGTKTEDKEYLILRKALSEDEKRILDEIKKAGEITQDSLRFRLDWSKAKTSTILTNLDKMNLIQRERTGKTYKVYLQKKPSV
ncbi:hypothetical protein HYW21_02425 [Candidatus Woesearchaeota archaeon]|nr:hypothetical protein [Candidatus Woesearchaeota archaeon]